VGSFLYPSSSPPLLVIPSLRHRLTLFLLTLVSPSRISLLLPDSVILTVAALNFSWTVSASLIQSVVALVLTPDCSSQRSLTRTLPFTMHQFLLLTGVFSSLISLATSQTIDPNTVPLSTRGKRPIVENVHWADLYSAKMHGAPPKSHNALYCVCKSLERTQRRPNQIPVIQ
jgi:hypothetical protein